MYKWYRLFRYIFRKNVSENSGTIFQRLLRIRGTPQEIASGFALGLLISLTPTFGLQIICVLFLATLFKVNRIAAVLGVFFSNPFTAPFIYTGTYLAGLQVWPYPAPPFPDAVISFAYFKALFQQTPELLIIMTAGGMIIGVPAASFSYFLILKLLRRYREFLQAQPVDS